MLAALTVGFCFSNTQVNVPVAKVRGEQYRDLKCLFTGSSSVTCEAHVVLSKV